MIMGSFITRVAAAALLTAASTTAGAASLQVSPVGLEIRAPGATSTVTLRNEGPAPINAQARVFRWTQVDGKERLEPTNAVVASPPIASLASRVNYTIRVVRTSREPIGKEEAYRLLLDELPNERLRKAGTVQLLLRHSVPVFFVPKEASAPKLKWSVQTQRGRVVLTVKNEGGRRVKIAKLRVKDASGKTLSFGEGLVGYALAGATMTWSRPAPRGWAGASTSITAIGDGGPINVNTNLASAQ
jgi:fimbrial chaperone protein